MIIDGIIEAQTLMFVLHGHSAPDHSGINTISMKLFFITLITLVVKSIAVDEIIFEVK